VERRKDEEWQDWAFDLIGRRWKPIALIVWLGFCGWFIFSEWKSIRYFALGDTDDNMRIMQVRALLHGQGWFDLRQYRMNPPLGANIHWSRLVDLPIAGPFSAEPAPSDGRSRSPRCCPIWCCSGRLR
jgi:hypothetical protein